MMRNSSLGKLEIMREAWKHGGSTMGLSQESAAYERTRRGRNPIRTATSTPHVGKVNALGTTSFPTGFHALHGTRENSLSGGHEICSIGRSTR